MPELTEELIASMPLLTSEHVRNLKDFIWGFYNIPSYNNFEFFPNNCFQFCFILNLYNHSQESKCSTVKKQVFYSHDCTVKTPTVKGQNVLQSFWKQYISLSYEQFGD